MVCDSVGVFEESSLSRSHVELAAAFPGVSLMGNMRNRPSLPASARFAPCPLGSMPA